MKAGCLQEKDFPKFYSIDTEEEYFHAIYTQRILDCIELCFDFHGFVMKPYLPKEFSFNIKEDTYYGLYNKEFREVIEVDGINSLLISQKNNVQKVVLNEEIKSSYIFTKNGISAHGRSVKQAYRDWLFKQSDRDVSKYRDLDPDEMHDLSYWYECYRAITGACAAGTEHFIEQYKPKNKMTLNELIEITKGQYGHNTFVEFFRGEEDDR